jgi:PEP-CTERM motif
MTSKSNAAPGRLGLLDVVVLIAMAVTAAAFAAGLIIKSGIDVMAGARKVNRQGLFTSSNEKARRVWERWSSFTGGTQTISEPDVNISGFEGTVAAYELNLFGSSGQTVSFTFDNLEAGAVPEPSTYALLMMGLGFVGFCHYRRLVFPRAS